MNFGQAYNTLAAMDNAAADAWLMAPTERACRCGAPMARWESLNGRCDRCRLATISAADEGGASATAGRTKAGIPERYLRYGWDTWLGPQPAMFAPWRQHRDEPLYIHGPNGGGKTHAATALLAELIDQGVWCVWASALQLQQRLTDELAGQERPLWKRLRGCHVLLLDDVSTLAVGGTDAGQKRWAVEQIESLIDERYQAGRSLIATSNDSPEAFHAKNSRIAVRLCGGVRVAMGTRDRRAA